MRMFCRFELDQRTRLPEQEMIYLIWKKIIVNIFSIFWIVWCLQNVFKLIIDFKFWDLKFIRLVFNQYLLFCYINQFFERLLNWRSKIRIIQPPTTIQISNCSILQIYAIFPLRYLSDILECGIYSIIIFTTVSGLSPPTIDFWRFRAEIIPQRQGQIPVQPILSCLRRCTSLPRCFVRVCLSLSCSSCSLLNRTFCTHYHGCIRMLLKRMLGSFAIVVSATTLMFAVLIVTKHRKLKKELQEVDVNSINLERYSGN